MEPSVWTIGYQSASPQHIRELANESLIVDTRLSAYSPNPQWTQEALTRLLGDQYVWIRELGNRNFNNGGDIAILNLERGLDRLDAVRAGRPVILMCACRDFDTCHRTVVAKALAARWGTDVQHLLGDRQPVARAEKGDVRKRPRPTPPPPEGQATLW